MIAMNDKRIPTQLSLHAPEVEALAWICEQQGITRAEWARRHIRREALANRDKGCPLPPSVAALFGDVVPTDRPKKKRGK